MALPSRSFSTLSMMQVITGSHDKTVKLWDLRKGKAMTTLTYHKKSVRGLALHPTEYCFASASAENIKKFRLPRVSPFSIPAAERCERLPCRFAPSLRTSNNGLLLQLVTCQMPRCIRHDQCPHPMSSTNQAVA